MYIHYLVVLLGTYSLTCMHMHAFPYTCTCTCTAPQYAMRPIEIGAKSSLSWSQDYMHACVHVHACVCAHARVRVHVHQGHVQVHVCLVGP